MGLRQASLSGVALVAMALLFTSGCIRSLRPNSPPRGGVLRPGPGEADPIVVNGIAAGDYSLGDGPGTFAVPTVSSGRSWVPDVRYPTYPSGDGDCGKNSFCPRMRALLFLPAPPWSTRSRPPS